MGGGILLFIYLFFWYLGGLLKAYELYKAEFYKQFLYIVLIKTLK